MKQLLTLFCALILSTTMMGQTGGQNVFNVLDIPISAHSAALGGNAMAIPDGALELAVFNPSLLSPYHHKNLSLSYVNYYAGVNLGMAAFAFHPDSSKITYQAAVQFADYGTFDERDASGIKTGNFNAGDYILNLGASMPIDTNFTGGVNLKFIYGTLAEYSSLALALDAGVTYHNTARKFHASLLLRNLGSSLATYTSTGEETLPTSVQLGFSKQLQHAPFRFHVVYDHMEQWDLTLPTESGSPTLDPITGEAINNGNFNFGDKLMRHLILGTELLLGENFRVNLGYNYKRRQELKLTDKPGTAGFSWGLAFKVKKFHLSYGRSSYHLAGPSNHFTVSTSLQNW